MNTPTPLFAGDHLLYGRTPWDLFGFITSLKTWSPAVHIEIYEGFGMSLASRNGVGVNSYPYREEQLIAVVRPPNTFEFERGLKWFDGVRGKPYGWLDLLRFVGINIKTNGLICSEFVAMFDRVSLSYPFNLNYPEESVDPGDFLLPRDFQWIWVHEKVNKYFGIKCDVQ